MSNLDNQENAPRPVCWYEGMLLSPQHFQQDHIYWESQLQALTLNLSPYRWGVSEMTIDEGRLLEGTVVVKQLKAIMPDGLQVDFDCRFDAQSLELPLKDNELLAKRGTVRVYLTVPIRIAGAASEAVDIQRFSVTDSRPVKDDNTGDGELVIQRLAPIMSLQAVEHVKEQYVALPLLEVSQRDGGQFVVSEYCPPVLGIHADTFLFENDLTMERKSLQQRPANAGFEHSQKSPPVGWFFRRWRSATGQPGHGAAS